jgi:hypothetical protein
MGEWAHAAGEARNNVATTRLNIQRSDGRNRHGAQLASCPVDEEEPRLLLFGSCGVWLRNYGPSDKRR